jgi:hypothetical protein
MKRGTEWYVPGPGAVILALAAGALTGGVSIGVAFAVSTILESHRDAATVLPVALIVSFFAFVVYATGLAVLAAPIWAVLHAVGLRGWRAAVLLGGGLCFLVGFGMAADGAVSAYQAAELLPAGAHSGGLFAASGAIVGFVIWKVAYRRRPSKAGSAHAPV